MADIILVDTGAGLWRAVLILSYGGRSAFGDDAGADGHHGCVRVMKAC